MQLRGIALATLSIAFSVAAMARRTRGRAATSDGAADVAATVLPSPPMDEPSPPCSAAEGSLSSTCKYALFIAILGLCINTTEASGAAPSSLTTREPAIKAVELRWDRLAPYRAHGTFRFAFGHGGQAEILRRIESVRARWTDDRGDTVFGFQAVYPEPYERFLDFVDWKLIEMPIPRLQRLGRGDEERFLYEYNWPAPVRRSVVTAYQEKAPETFAHSLALRPGVADELVRPNGLLRLISCREWAVRVAKLSALPEAGFEHFLFDVDRASPSVVRKLLRDWQDDCCSDCGGRFIGGVDVAISFTRPRHGDNGLDNLVPAHGKCNNSKGDFLASAEHVERWTELSGGLDADLAAVARECGWPRDRDRSTAVARAVCIRLPAGARMWRGPDTLDSVDHTRFRRALVPVGHQR